jgi:hypothetical protein
MNMLERFFSIEYKGKGEVFEGLNIWNEQKYRDLQGRYIITSNRESGFGRYDIMLEPQNDCDPAIIIEFKVINKSRENSLEETVQAALQQIEEKDYARQLTDRGFAPERIHSYGFAFQGKTVLIGE